MITIVQLSKELLERNWLLAASVVDLKATIHRKVKERSLYPHQKDRKSRYRSILEIVNIIS